MPRTIISFLALLVSTHLLLAQNSRENDTSLPGPLPSNPNIITISQAHVGNPGNKPDSSLKTNYGAISYNYWIGTDEITAQQYCSFLKSVACQGDPHHLYDRRMSSDERVKCIIPIFDIHGTIVDYSVIPGRENLPITYVSWYSGARFCNWLENNQPRGNETSDTTEDGVYTFSGEEIINFQQQNRYHIPTEDEWYKAAYYNKGILTPNGGLYWNYPTCSDLFPGNSTNSPSLNQANYQISSGWWNHPSCQKDPPYITAVETFKESPGPYGTYDMGGNVAEWTSACDKNGLSIARGGSWQSQYHTLKSNDLERESRTGYDPSKGYNFIGFRIAGFTTPSPLLPQTSLTEKPSTTSVRDLQTSNAKANPGLYSRFSSWYCGLNTSEKAVVIGSALLFTLAVGGAIATAGVGAEVAALEEALPAERASLDIVRSTLEETRVAESKILESQAVWDSQISNLTESLNTSLESASADMNQVLENNARSIANQEQESLGVADLSNLTTQREAILAAQEDWNRNIQQARNLMDQAHQNTGEIALSLLKQAFDFVSKAQSTIQPFI